MSMTNKHFSDLRRKFYRVIRNGAQSLFSLLSRMYRNIITAVKSTHTLLVSWLSKLCAIRLKKKKVLGLMN